jgi:mono/diheme cytochrome c family protein
MGRSLRIGLTAAALLVATPALAQSPNALRGQRLYETTCTGCHAQSVHSRVQKSAQSVPAIREFAVRWARVVNAPWTNEEIEDVVTYLNERYYKYRCGPGESPCRDERASLVSSAPR